MKQVQLDQKNPLPNKPSTTQRNSSGTTPGQPHSEINELVTIQVFVRLTEIYGSQFADRYGAGVDEDNQMSSTAQTWMRLMRYARVDSAGIQRAFRKIAAQGIKWPPNASEFIALCHIDATEAQQIRQQQAKEKPLALPNHKRTTTVGMDALANLKAIINAKEHKPCD